MKKASARPFPFWILLLLLPAAAALLFLLFGKPKAQREDYRLIASRTYDAAFLSMYPTHSYSEEDFQYYLGLNVFRASYCIPGLSVMEEYLEKIAASGNAVSTVYLGIRPDKTELSDLHALTARYPSVNFEIILSYPSLDFGPVCRRGPIAGYFQTMPLSCPGLWTFPMPISSFSATWNGW